MMAHIQGRNMYVVVHYILLQIVILLCSWLYVCIDIYTLELCIIDLTQQGWHTLRPDSALPKPYILLAQYIYLFCTTLTLAGDCIKRLFFVIQTRWILWGIKHFVNFLTNFRFLKLNYCHFTLLSSRYERGTYRNVPSNGIQTRSFCCDRVIRSLWSRGHKLYTQ